MMPHADSLPAPLSLRCQRCDYNLRGLAAGTPCPECGLDFDPDDPETFHTGRPTSMIARSLLGTLGRPTVVVRITIVVGLSFLLAQPAMFYRGVGLCVTMALLAPILLVAGLRRVLLLDAAAGRERLYRQPIQADARHGLVMIGVVSLLAFGTHLALPTRLWFYPLLPWFEHVVDQAEAELPATDLYALNPPSLDRWIGPWHVTVERRGDAIVLYTSGQSFPGGGDGFVRTAKPTGMPGYNKGDDALLTPRWHVFVTD